jgi:hypothetical protein
MSPKVPLLREMASIHDSITTIEMDNVVLVYSLLIYLWLPGGLGIIRLLSGALEKLVYYVQCSSLVDADSLFCELEYH